MTKKVLVADDERNILLSLEFLLKREGFEVTVAGDGDAALEAAVSSRPDLVLLDVMMPKKNGYEVCQRIRANPDLQATKVIMLTAKSREVEVARRRRLCHEAVLDQRLDRASEADARRGLTW